MLVISHCITGGLATPGCRFKAGDLARVIMVEGPGATRNSRKVQVAVGKTLIASDDTLPHLAGELVGHTLEQAFSVGKEVFLIFASPDEGSCALRLHFGMNGSLYARKVKSGDVQEKLSGLAPWKQKNDPSLRLYFVDNNNQCVIIVEAWETTVTYPVSATNAHNKLMDLASRDVCSTLFNAQDAFTSIRQLGNNLIISDALLNQDIFPGVGNIIKNEALHRSKVDPRRIVSSLTDAELRRIVAHTRKYSIDWLNKGRAGTKLVYNQTVCGTCKGMNVKMQKIGGGSGNGSDNDTRKGHAFMSRVTFWCSVCQPLHANEDGGIGSLKTSSTWLASGTAASNGNTVANRQAQCPQHGQKSLKLCRSRKGQNDNMMRIFFTCKKKGCQYFEWADRSFSNCLCSKKAILRVSKTASSGGRWFLCCASGDRSSKGASNGCGHFEWAKDEQLATLRPLLTPLL